MADRFEPIKGNKAEGPMKESFELALEQWSNHPFLALYNKMDEYIRWFEGGQYRLRHRQEELRVVRRDAAHRPLGQERL